MCLAFAARPSTADVDAVFLPQETVRRLARLVAADAGVEDGWLNDAVKGYLSERGEFSPWLELAHLKVFVPVPEYLLAMKAVALAVVERYFPPERVPAKTRLALGELLPPR